MFINPFSSDAWNIMSKIYVSLKPEEIYLKDAVSSYSEAESFFPEDPSYANMLGYLYITAGMKSKWRYNIRLAEKKDVKIKKSCAEDADFEKSIDTFYDLYRITSERDGIALHSKSYYLDLFKYAQQMPAAPKISLYTAEHEGMPLAAIITLFTEKQAVYLYGASSNEKRNLMPAYLLQWTALCDAKKHGCVSYDFYGIPPTDDESHPMHGLYRFKTGFGGSIVHRIGSIDVPLSLLYMPYTFAEKLRLIWFKKLKKLLRKK